MCSIPDGIYELKIGESFIGSQKQTQPEFNTLRFDFKPASISSGSETYLTVSRNENDIQVIVPGKGNKSTIFQGSKKPNKGDKECLLVFEKETNGLHLEKLSANINVKKTRDAELDNLVKSEIDRMHQSKIPQKAKKESKERTFSISSTSMNGDEEHDEGDDDEDVSALEQLMASKTDNDVVKEKPQVITKSSLTNENFSPIKTQKGLQKSILHEDLQLSESSDGEDY